MIPETDQLCVVDQVTGSPESKLVNREATARRAYKDDERHSDERGQFTCTAQQCNLADVCAVAK